MLELLLGAPVFLLGHKGLDKRVELLVFELEGAEWCQEGLLLETEAVGELDHHK